MDVPFKASILGIPICGNPQILCRTAKNPTKQLVGLRHPSASSQSQAAAHCSGWNQTGPNARHIAWAMENPRTKWRGESSVGGLQLPCLTTGGYRNEDQLRNMVFQPLARTLTLKIAAWPWMFGRFCQQPAATRMIRHVKWPKRPLDH